MDFQVVDSKDIAGVLNLNARIRFRKTAAPPTFEESRAIRA